MNNIEAISNEIQANILKEAEEFTDNYIRPFASEFDEKGSIPLSLILEMGQRGYLAASIPKQYGGLGLDPLAYGKFTEIIGKACASTRAILTVHTSLVGETILRWGDEDQKRKYLPSMATGECIACFALTEPEIGTDAKSIKTNYEKEGDFYLINGRKKWITLSGIADLFLVIASNESEKTAFLVDKDSNGITVSPISGLLAGKAAYISEIDFKNVKVPTRNILGKLGNGFNYITNTALDNGRYSIAWGGLGIAQEALEAMVSYSRNRHQFGKALYSFQLIQGMIGDAVTNIHAARALCVNAGKMRSETHKDSVMETNIAKYFTSKVANKVTSDCVQIHGGNGCYNKFPAERLYREAKILEIIEGTSQVQQEIISRYGLRKYYKIDYKNGLG